MPEIPILIHITLGFLLTVAVWWVREERRES